MSETPPQQSQTATEPVETVRNELDNEGDF